MSPQQLIAHYRITAKLGEGGMGEVWRATDTKLSREVAIKVLPQGFAADADRMARFQREAQVLASLNHPNIAAIYGIEQSAIVMELVEGQTLAERMAEGPLPPEEAVPIAQQMAEALEYAHEKGIIHRDLKPSNIKISPPTSASPGRVKVLDFGLAKALNEDAMAVDSGSSQTLTMGATMAGMIVGTAGYMSPEQASGKPTDRRTDIWSYGVVLWEMLTGKRLFEGETISHTLADVLRGEIDCSKLPANTPPSIRDLIGRCLERNPRSRLRDIGEARVLIERGPGAAGATAEPSRPAPRWRAMAPWIAAAFFCAAAGVFASLLWGGRRPEPVVRFLVPQPPKTTVLPFDLPSISPDGRHLALTAAGQADGGPHMLWVRPMDSVEVRPLPGTEGAFLPFWSPDSRWIAFTANGKLLKVSAGGGPVTLLWNSPPVVGSGSWSTQGVILMGSTAGPIQQIPDSGGEPKPALSLASSRHETGQLWPQFMPDGKHFIYFSLSATAGGIYAGTLGSTQTKQILPIDARATFATPGHLLFLRQQTLMAQPFDSSRLQLEGSAVPIAEGVGSVGAFGGANWSVSANGVLVYRAANSGDSTITLFDRSGKRLRTIGPPGQYAQISLSPDGKRLAIDRKDNAANSYDLWILELATGIMSRLTFDPANERDATWSPDSRQIVFDSDRTGQKLLYRTTVGSGVENLLYQSAEQEIPEVWLKNGAILFGNFQGKKYSLLRPGEPGAPQQVFQSNFTMDEPSVSPDQKWIAYGSTESGRFEVYTARFPDFTDRRQVSSSSGVQPHWRQDGKQIVYLTLDGKLMAMDVQRGETLETGTPYPLFETRIRASGTVEQFCMSADGTQFYLADPMEEGEKPMTVVLNWPTQLRR